MVQKGLYTGGLSWVYLLPIWLFLMILSSFITSDTPIAKLLDKEIPAVQAAKKDLEQVIKKHQSAQVTSSFKF